METIKLRVSGNQIQVTECPAVITAGTVGLNAEFTFDSRWDGLTKTAVFKAGDKVIAAAMENNAHTVPWEVLKKPSQWLCIGVYGANAKGTAAIPTLWARVAVIHTGADPEADPGVEPTAPVWQEVMSGVEEVRDRLQYVDDLSADNQKAIEMHMGNAEGENPHGITCEQIGAAPIERMESAENAIQELTNLSGDNLVAINSHIGNDVENPHGVTCEQIGAAPAGYGLGENSSHTQNWNGAYVNGFVRGNSNSPDGKIWYGIVCRDSANNAATAELAFSVEAGNLITEARRARNTAGVWGGWEYVEPPMLPGVEYRTAERWMGKPVYTKLLSCGAAFDQKVVDLEDQFCIIRAEGCILNAEAVPVCPLPNGQLAWLEIAADIGNITLRCQDASYCGEDSSLYIRLWYVK